MFGTEGRMVRHTARRAVALLAAAGLATVAVRRSLVRVHGLSMRPTLREGDLVVTVPLPPLPDDAPTDGLALRLRQRFVRPGMLVVLSEPGDRTHLIIKRAAAVSRDGVEVMGDDPGWSIDSRTFGTVPHRDVRRIALGPLPLPGR
jgi:signal peptidase I